MKKKLSLLLMLIPCLLFSCHKDQSIYPYQFERIDKPSFSSMGWKKQQVNSVSGSTTTIISDESKYVDVVCGPENTSDPTLIQGCVTMNLPTSDDPTLKRIRLRKGGYGGTRLTDITELKYSTYVIQNCPTIMVLQIDINNDGVRDFNIFFEPRRNWQGDNFPPLLLNTWQQWNTLVGTWVIEGASLPEFPDNKLRISDLINIPKYANAQIIDTPPVGNNGEGVRFTIGGTPHESFDNTIGYFDALIIGTKDQPQSTLYDFACKGF